MTATYTKLLAVLITLRRATIALVRPEAQKGGGDDCIGVMILRVLIKAVIRYCGNKAECSKAEQINGVIL